jgi:hypothetical protein
MSTPIPRLMSERSNTTPRPVVPSGSDVAAKRGISATDQQKIVAIHGPATVAFKGLWQDGQEKEALRLNHERFVLHWGHFADI